MTSIENDKEGDLRKRGGRMQRWNHRYVMLSGTKITYKNKFESTKIRGTFDLAPGCIVTEPTEEHTLKGKKIYVFWVIWPYDKNSKQEEVGDDSDDDEHRETTDGSDKAQKNLKEIVENEAMQLKKQQKLVEEQLERHQAHDKNVSFGAKMAGVVVSGAIIGALTAGIGLVPFAAVVGTLAAAGGGGGVALRVRRPVDSRLILGCESLAEAVAWKVLLEEKIALLEPRPILPSFADPTVIRSIMNKNIEFWKRIQVHEGVRILEHVSCINSAAHYYEAPTKRCMKAQLFVRNTPFAVFLALMENKHWPQGGSIKVLKTLDDHAELLSFEIKTKCGCHPFVEFLSTVFPYLNSMKPTYVTRTLCLSRFWKVDDDNTYLITLNSAKHEGFTPQLSTSKSNKPPVAVTPPAVDAVFTIAARRDYNEYDDDVAEALVTCTLQVDSNGWEDGEIEPLMINFLTQNLLELRQTLQTGKFVFNDMESGTRTSEESINRRSSYNEETASDVATETLTSTSQDSQSAESHTMTTVTASSLDQDITQGNFAMIEKESPRRTNEVKVDSSRRESQTFSLTEQQVSTAAMSLTDDDDVTPDMTIPVRSAMDTKEKKRRFGGVLSSIRHKMSRSRDSSPVEQRVTDEAVTAALQEPTAAGSPTSPPKSMFRRRFLFGKKDKAPPGPNYKLPNDADSPPLKPPMPNKPPPRRSFFSTKGDNDRVRARSRSRSRPVSVNSVASALRSQIATKEYEVQRVEKLMKKKDGTASNDRMVQGVPQQLAELAQLKAEYMELTGMSYDQSCLTKKRRSLMTWSRRSSGTSVAESSATIVDRSSNSEDYNALQKVIQQQQITGAKDRQNNKKTDHDFSPTIDPNGLPRHWNFPIRTLRFDLHEKYVEEAIITNDDDTINLYILVWFIISLLLTFLSGKYVGDVYNTLRSFFV